MWLPNNLKQGETLSMILRFKPPPKHDTTSEYVDMYVPLCRRIDLPL